MPRHEGVLLRRTFDPLVRRLPDPDPKPEQGLLHPGTDGVDDAGTVLVRHLGRVDRDSRPGGAPGLPVGGVDPGAVEPDPHLPRAGLGQRPIDERQDVGIPGLGVDDGAHASDGNPRRFAMGSCGDILDP